jgi:hypothetical protein
VGRGRYRIRAEESPAAVPRGRGFAVTPTLCALTIAFVRRACGACGISSKRSNLLSPAIGRADEWTAWLPVSDTSSATAGGMAAALMLATLRLLASTERPEFCRGALAGVERAFRAERGKLASRVRCT